MRRVPLISAIIEGLIKAIKAINCKCRSTCCDSECTQSPKSPKREKSSNEGSPKRDSSTQKTMTPEISDSSVMIGKIKHEVEL